MTPFDLDDVNAYGLWRDDATTAEARASLSNPLNGDDPLTIRHRLTAGRGLINYKVLHDRSGFADHDAPKRRRLLYPARFLNRIAA